MPRRKSPAPISAPWATRAEALTRRAARTSDALTRAMFWSVTKTMTSRTRAAFWPVTPYHRAESSRM